MWVLCQPTLGSACTHVPVPGTLDSFMCLVLLQGLCLGHWSCSVWDGTAALLIYTSELLFCCTLGTPRDLARENQFCNITHSFRELENFSRSQLTLVIAGKYRFGLFLLVVSLEKGRFGGTTDPPIYGMDVRSSFASSELLSSQWRTRAAPCSQK